MESMATTNGNIISNILGSTITEEEKLKLRQQRFNSGRNVTTQEASQLVEDEKRKILERQKKFGVITIIPEIEEEKRRQRLARFGGEASTTGQSAEDEEKCRQRAERFGIVNQDDLLKKRATRFGLSTSNETNKPEMKKSFKKRLFRRNNRVNKRTLRKPTQKNNFRDRRGPKRVGFRRNRRGRNKY